MTNKQLIEKIKTEILGIPVYGFEDENLWGPFIQTYFTREGTINGESYSSDLNQTLSRAALSQILNHIRNQLDALEHEE